jgi:hypothetical protein
MYIVYIDKWRYEIQERKEVPVSHAGIYRFEHTCKQVQNKG